MQFRVPKWYLLALLYALLANTGRAALTIRHDDDEDTDDDDEDDRNNGSHQRAGMNGNSDALTKHRVGRGAIAGIVIGCLLLLLLLLVLGWWCLRKRRNRARDAAVLAAVAEASPMNEKETSVVPLLVQRHPTALRPRSGFASSPTEPVSDSLFFSDSTGGRATQEMRNITPGAPDNTPLPNPYDGDNPPPPPPHDRITSSPTSPTSPSSYSSLSRYTSYQGTSSHSSNQRSSVAPSAWTHDESAVALLARGATQTSHRTSSSSLQEELTGYQKALEAHHRKEEEDAVTRQNGEGSSVPADPPPVYSPSQDK